MRAGFRGALRCNMTTATKNQIARKLEEVGFVPEKIGDMKDSELMKENNLQRTLEWLKPLSHRESGGQSNQKW